MGYAFISYSSKNQSAADALKELLNGKGIDTWMAPGDIPAGSSYMKEINHALKDCSCLILLLSNAAQRSEWVIKEVERAINYHKPVIPVQIEDVMLNDEFEFVLGSCQVVAVQKIDRDSDETKKILNSVSAAVGARRDAPSEDEGGRASSFRLESVGGKKTSYALKDGLNIVGRDSRKASVVLSSNYVSLIHASITVSGRTCTLRNINASNGTFLNRYRLSAEEERTIAPGDVVKFGDEEFIFQETKPYFISDDADLCDAILKTFGNFPDIPDEKQIDEFYGRLIFTDEKAARSKEEVFSEIEIYFDEGKSRLASETKSTVSAKDAETRKREDAAFDTLYPLLYGSREDLAKLRKAAFDKDNVQTDALFLFGIHMIVSGKDRSYGLSLVKKAAMSRNDRAAYIFAWLNETCLMFDTPFNGNNCREYYFESAERGYQPSILKMIEMIRSGYYCPDDYEEQARWEAEFSGIDEKEKNRLDSIKGLLTEAAENKE